MKGQRDYTLVLLENGNKTSFSGFYSPISPFLLSNEYINTKVGEILYYAKSTIRGTNSIDYSFGNKKLITITMQEIKVCLLLLIFQHFHLNRIFFSLPIFFQGFLHDTHIIYFLIYFYLLLLKNIFIMFPSTQFYTKINNMANEM